MKKWIGIGAVCLIAGGSIIFGQFHYNDKIERTVTEASEYVYSENGGNRAIGSSAARFNNDDSEEGNSASGTAGSSSSDGGSSSAGGVGGTNSSGENGDGSFGSSGESAGEEGSDSSVSGNGSSGSDGDSDSGTGSGSGSSSVSSTGGSSSSGSSSVSGSSGGGVSEQDIMNTYIRQFQSLQTQESNRVNELISNARTDYKLVQSGQSDMSKSELQLKYVGQVERLEQNADARFNDIYRELRTALDENGYDKAKAEEFKVVYEAEKESRRLDAIQSIFE